MASSVGMGHTLAEWYRPLIDAGVIPPATRRIIIDIPHDNIASVYYECAADKRMFTIGLAEMLKGVEAIGVIDAPEKL